MGVGGGTDWRGPVLALATWLGMWTGTSGVPPLLAGVALSAAAVAAWGWRRRRWLILAAALAVLVAVGIGGARVWAAGLGPVPEWARQEAVVTIDARIAGGRVTDGGRGGPLWTADAELLGVDGRGEAWLSGATVRLTATGGLLSAFAAVPVGARVTTVVRLAPAATDEPMSAWARVRALPTVVAPPGPIDAAVTDVRAGLARAVEGLPDGPRALVPALVVGDTDGMPEQLRADFRTTGLTHLTAVSGANLTLLLAAMLWVSGRLRIRGWWRRGVAVLGVVAFVLLCRAEPSVLRAAAMGLVGLAALGWGGSRQGLRFLSWAVIGLLLVDPWLGRSLGFVLSVTASAGIILWARRWSLALGSWLPRWAAEALTVPVAAQLATQPIVTAISAQVSVVGVVTNLLAAPLVGPGTVLGFLAAGVSTVSPTLATLVGWAAGGFAAGLCWIAETGASLPGAAIGWPASPLSVGLLAVICGAIAAGLARFWARPALVVAVALALGIALLRPVSVSGWPPGEWLMVSCDVGQGDATVVNAGSGRAIVVDAGPDPRLVDRCLDQLGVSEVSWLVFTHLHADHVGGVAGVASGRPVARVLFSGITEPASGWASLVSAVGSVPRTVAVPGLVVAAGAAQVAVLAVRPFVGGGVVAGEDSAAENDSSLVMRITSGDVTLLASGDVEEAGQENAVATGADLRAQVLLVPHHGSGHQSPSYLNAIGAGVALVSVGKDNDYGHPAVRTVQGVLATGARVFRTDQQGSLAVSRSGDRLLVTTERGG